MITAPAQRADARGDEVARPAVTAPAAGPIGESEGGDRLARETAGIVATSGSLYAAALEVLGHRLPIICATSPAPFAWQVAELWQMSLEKPLALWQAWASLGAWPFAAASLMARSAARQAPAGTLALALAADGASAMRATLDAIHEQVAANATRLDRQGS